MNKREKEKIKTPQGIRLAEIIFEMGKTERSFAKLLGYAHPSIIYAAQSGRRISPDLMKKIKDKYFELQHKNINPEWLLEGTLPKLLTDKIRMRLIDDVEESATLYSQKCLLCAEKDKKIELLRSELETLRKEYIECLKEVSGLKKAASG